MTITQDHELEGLRDIGAIVAAVLRRMIAAIEPGMTTRELDGIGRALLDKEGARSAPELTYDFPGATCISVNECVAHGIPDDTVIGPADLVNIDVSAEKGGFFADTGASVALPGASPRAHRLCQDGRGALCAGMKDLRAGASLGGIGRRVQHYAHQRGYTLVRNLASHGVGAALHEEPGEIPTWFDPRERRRIHEGLVFTIEPFLSTGAQSVEVARDGWSLMTRRGILTVQYEHTMVATRDGIEVLTAGAH